MKVLNGYFIGVLFLTEAIGMMECPKSVKISNIARLNREFICAKLAD